jgi:predicted nucleic acid-binding protein
MVKIPSNMRYNSDKMHIQTYTKERCRRGTKNREERLRKEGGYVCLSAVTIFSYLYGQLSIVSQLRSNCSKFMLIVLKYKIKIKICIFLDHLINK